MSTAENNKKAAPTSGGGGESRPNAGKRKTFSRRENVPEDVKLALSEVKNEKKKLKRKVDRLQTASDKHKAAKFDLQKQVYALKVELEKTKRELEELKEQKDGELDKKPAAVSVAAAQPADPLSPPGACTFEERFRELQHFKAGNGHCRVPIRTPGIGRWIMEIRAIYQLCQEDPTVLDIPGLSGVADLTRERIKRLDGK